MTALQEQSMLLINFLCHGSIMNTGGAYRNDSKYYESIVERLERLTQMCHKLNLNVYFETHKDCISEDTQSRLTT